MTLNPLDVDNYISELQKISKLFPLVMKTDLANHYNYNKENMRTVEAVELLALSAHHMGFPHSSEAFSTSDIKDYEDKIYYIFKHLESFISNLELHVVDKSFYITEKSYLEAYNVLQQSLNKLKT